MHKILGYCLVCVGICMVFFSLIGMYKVFVSRQPVVPIVQLADMNLTTQYGTLSLPMGNINTVANIGLFALLMLFVLSAGSKLALLGVNFIKIERLREALLIRGENITPEMEKTLKKL